MEAFPGGYVHRWRALGVLCLALSIIVIDNTILAVAFPSIQRGLHTERGRPAVDRCLVRPGAGGSAAPARSHRRPPRAQGHAHDRAGHLRCGVRRGGLRADCRVAHHRPRGHGCRWRVHDAVDALGARQHLPGGGARAGHLHLVGGRGHLHRGRTVGGRAAARALLVGLGVPRERARGDRRPRARGALGAEVARPRHAAHRPVEHAAVVGSAHHVDRRDHRRPAARLGVAAGPALGRGRDRSVRRLRATRGALAGAA